MLNKITDNQDKFLKAAISAFDIEAEAIAAAKEYFSEASFLKAVELIASAGKVGTSGCGHSGIMCQHLSHLLCCIEKPSRFISPSEAVHGAMGFMQAGDLMILASRGGKTKELIPILEICKKKKVSVITITENLESPLAVGADVVIKQFVTRETDPYNSQGTTSSTILAVIFHALQAALIVHTGFKNDQFALIHPGGAVGERLNSGH